MTRKTEQDPETLGPAKALTTVPAGSCPGAVGSSLPPRHDPEEPVQQGTGGYGLYWHAFRRRWPLAMILGLCLGATGAAVAWFLTIERYTAASLLQISATKEKLVFRPEDRADANEFEIFKKTQQDLLTSSVVLTAALRNAEAAALPAVQKQGDPVRWLAKNLRVDFPNEAEIMRVSLTYTEPKEAAVLVAAVADAYIDEVVDADRHRQRDRLADVERLYAEKEMEMRSRRTKLKQLVEQLGAGETGALAFRQQIAVQAYGDARNELYKLRAELQRARDDLQIKQVWLKALKDSPQQSFDPEPFIAADPTLIKLADQIMEIDARISNLHDSTKEPLFSKLVGQLTQTKKVLEDKRDARRKELAARAPKVKQADLGPEIAELKARVEILAAEEKAAAKDADEQRQKAERFGTQSIDVQMMQSELQYLDKVLGPIADEREKLKVELRAPPRISIFQRPDVPKLPDSKARLISTAVAGGGGFFGIILLVLRWDVGKRRINSLADLSHGLGLTVIGAVPLLPNHVIQMSSVNNRHRRKQSIVNHAVDSIAARLFLRKDSGGVHVVMVSSAVQGEGKTTLAVQLAIRLARAGERTLLVDYDLRRPSLHRIFGVPRSPGVAECLRNHCEPQQVVRATHVDSLFLVTAGTAFVNSLGPLSNGVTTAFFEKAREAFTFIVIDGCPILPVIDGLLVSQHADTVVLSVRRDTSEAAQVLAPARNFRSLDRGNASPCSMAAAKTYVAIITSR